MTRILIAEDEERIVSFLQKGLKANGFTTTAIADGEQALTLVRSQEFDLMILDIGIPGKNGFEVLRELRGSGNRMPVVILTARNNVGDTVAGFEGGADDYVTKPFRFEELLARVRARLRVQSSPEETMLVAGDIALDLRARHAIVNGEPVSLSAREFALAQTFFRHPGQVLSREQLLSHVWGYDFDPHSNIVDVYVRYLRRKLGSKSIASVRGLGYRLVLRPAWRDDAPPGVRR